MGEYPAPKLIPAAVDYSFMEPPVIVNYKDVPGQKDPDGGVTKWLLTEYNAGIRYHAAGVYLAEPGKGFTWHVHPEETEEEELLYVASGKGKLTYKKNRTEYSLEFKQDEGIYTGHLSHRIDNTGSEPLLIFFMIAPLPVSTVIHGGLRDRGLGYVDYAHLAPPVIGRPGERELFHFGRLDNKQLIDGPKVGLKHMSFLQGVVERVGLGSLWHTHTIETGQEDVFYVVNGHGTYVYIKENKVHAIPFRDGDAVFSKHLTNYTWNSGTEDIRMATGIAPVNSKSLLHDEIGESTVFTHR